MSGSKKIRPEIEGSQRHGAETYVLPKSPKIQIGEGTGFSVMEFRWELGGHVFLFGGISDARFARAV